jgi:SanA protein
MLRMLILFASLLLALLLLPRLISGVYTSKLIHSAEQTPQKPVAIVFGAGLRRDGHPTPVLRDRVATAADLYFKDKVDMLMMSGNYRIDGYNEPEAMRTYAIQLGVPSDVILLDYAGNRTYDTCYRAIKLFGIQSASLVTQKFHLPRAVYTCNRLGGDAVGVIADRRPYHTSSMVFWKIRETVATWVAFLEVNLIKPQPNLDNNPPREKMEAQ